MFVAVVNSWVRYKRFKKETDYVMPLEKWSLWMDLKAILRMEQLYEYLYEIHTIADEFLIC